MELLEGIETRRSIRAFKPTPVPRETIEKVLRAASRSPSYGNTQPWEVAVACGKKKEELSKILQNLTSSEIKPNPDIPFPTSWPAELKRRRSEHTATRFKVLGIEREDTEKRRALLLLNCEFFGAPCVLFLFQDTTLTPWSIFDIGMFAQSVALAAHSFSLGSCLQGALVSYPDAVRAFLGIPKEKRLIIGISIGYPDPEAKINTYHSDRVGLDTFARWYT